MLRPATEYWGGQKKDRAFTPPLTFGVSWPPNPAVPPPLTQVILTAVGCVGGPASNWWVGLSWVVKSRCVSVSDFRHIDEPPVIPSPKRYQEKVTAMADKPCDAATVLETKLRRSTEVNDTCDDRRASAKNRKNGLDSEYESRLDREVPLF